MLVFNFNVTSVIFLNKSLTTRESLPKHLYMTKTMLTVSAWSVFQNITKFHYMRIYIVSRKFHHTKKQPVAINRHWQLACIRLKSQMIWVSAFDQKTKNCLPHKAYLDIVKVSGLVCIVAYHSKPLISRLHIIKWMCS